VTCAISNCDSRRYVAVFSRRYLAVDLAVRRRVSIDDRSWIRVPEGAYEILTLVNDLPVREAEARDLPALAALRWQFKLEDAASSDDAENEGVFIARCEEWLRTRIRTGQWKVWLAESNGQPCGHVFLSLVEKVPSPLGGSAVLGYVTNFYVAPEQRNRGLGTALLAEVTRFAEAHCLDTLIVWPSERSSALYQRCGFNQPAELLERPIAPN